MTKGSQLLDLDGLLETLADAVAQRVAELQPRPEHQRWMSVERAAAYLDVTEHALRAMVKRAEVPFLKRGSRLVFDRCALDAWLEELPT